MSEESFFAVKVSGGENSTVQVTFDALKPIYEYLNGCDPKDIPKYQNIEKLFQ